MKAQRRAKEPVDVKSVENHDGGSCSGGERDPNLGICYSNSNISRSLLEI
ncbi:hypothetical protein A2U01_0030941 [Trifolium medium]|uniref:Uncharacterized protein n=1 Tax=Trifolium medium TaxID=97028 RepID=A0A392PEF3_9FABA|nr:hypothetical protein [Trifolium medium]